ncbi:recombination-associated protein RdgC [Pseudomonas putida]|uniref:recombination-associated protein RdgC n=1 Tax=Pseudomonas putida TaxID=303 RepID=UPI0027E3E7B3|nr:recombination-associated protein RdgC [Pseudomonas putida]
MIINLSVLCVHVSFFVRQIVLVASRPGVSCIMFSNLHLYRITEPWRLSTAELAKRLEKKAFTPCSGSVTKTQGWVEPRVGSGLVLEVQKQILLNLCFEEKKVPGVWGAMEPKTNVSSESHRKGAFRSPAHRRSSQCSAIRSSLTDWRASPLSLP